MNTKKPLSIHLISMLLSMILLFAALPVTVHAATVIEVSTAEELSAACSTANANGGEYTINLQADIAGTITVNHDDAVVTVIGNGHTLTAPKTVANADRGVLNLGDGNSELILRSDGTYGEDPGVVYIFGTNAVCNMYDKVTVTGRRSNNYFGGGVTIRRGIFHMYGGTITDCGINGGSTCFGGGVSVTEGGSFIMDGGKITNCSVTNAYHSGGAYNGSAKINGAGGGVVVVSGGSFTMNDGEISNCKSDFGGGVAMLISSGEYTNSRNTYGSYYGYTQNIVTINGGTIKDNTAKYFGGGIFSSAYFYTNQNALCQYNPPIGFNPDTGLYINGGTISGNNATEGGGIFTSAMMETPTQKVQIHNATISNNTAVQGAGIEATLNWVQANIDNCTITNNAADQKGGGILLENNVQSNGTTLSNTTITGNTSGDRGAGVYYDANSKLTISGANTIQNNTYNGSLNNLNIYSKDWPVFVGGDLTGSQIGLSDPPLWDDDLDDIDPTAESEIHLTSGYSDYNTANPFTIFTSDHESWVPDYSEVTSNEVRLVRGGKVDYHINNESIVAEYNNDDIFTPYIEAVKGETRVGKVIEECYVIPEVTPTAQNSCPYIFKGWYYDQDNEDDDDPVVFGTDRYISEKDIYAHWIKVENVDKDERDENILPAGDNNQYGGFDLAGVQIRKEMRDYNFDSITPGGMRFVASLSMNVVREINAIKPDNIEYGYVAATSANWIEFHRKGVNEKLQYVSETANGVDTSSANATDENYFGFAHNVNCTSRATNRNGVVALDHQNYDDYLLYTFVVTYENGGSAGYDTNVLARPYIRYTDANGLERVAYSEYRGTNVIGGCYTNYNAIAQ